jgi:hypothetical protein
MLPSMLFSLSLDLQADCKRHSKGHIQPMKSNRQKYRPKYRLKRDFNNKSTSTLRKIFHFRYQSLATTATSANQFRSCLSVCDLQRNDENTKNYDFNTERCGRVGSSPASQHISARRPVILAKVFRDFLGRPWNTGIVPKIRPRRHPTYYSAINLSFYHI